MRRSRLLGRALTALALTGGMAVAAAPAAQAATHAQPFCESGGGQFICSLQHDGVAPLTIEWSINGVHVPSLDNKAFIARRSCAPGSLAVSATVADVNGSATGSVNVWCNYGPWQ